MSLNIVHLSPTPLVAAPSKIARAQRAAGDDAIAILVADYPKTGPLAGKFTEECIVMSEADSQIRQLIEFHIRGADIIHVHNDLSADTVKWVREIGPNAKYVYQVHSPLREGPLYYERAPVIGLPFVEYLAVGQYQPRHYPNYRPVPNIVLDEPSIKLRLPGEKLRVMFSPSHTRAGRWNAKQSDALDRVLKSLSDLGQIELVQPAAPVHPSILLALRRTCHVSIDEIVTGAFHQVSIEGLCAGTAVINRADYFSRAMMACCARTEDFPPFVFADDTTIADVMLGLSQSVDMTQKYQRASFDYFVANLRSSQLVHRFKEIYESIQ